MALFCRICHYFNLLPAVVLYAVDRIALLFSQNGYAIVFNEDNIDDDTIINKVNSYYKEHPHKINGNPYSILSIPYDSVGNLIIPEVVAWCLGWMQQGGHNE